MTDTDFQSTQVTVSASQKMDEIGALSELARRRASTSSPTPAIGSAPTSIPFRGNPSDVKVLSVDGTANVYVPLGGDVMTPGNEVAIVQNNQLLTRIKVGVRPQRLAVHPAGLVFVCNQYSNYISIIDPISNQLLTERRQAGRDQDRVLLRRSRVRAVGQRAGPRSPVPLRRQPLAPQRAQVPGDVVRDPLSNRPIDVVQPATSTRPQQAHAEILGVGNNPFRLAVADQQNGAVRRQQQGRRDRARQRAHRHGRARASASTRRRPTWSTSTTCSTSRRRCPTAASSRSDDYASGAGRDAALERQGRRRPDAPGAPGLAVRQHARATTSRTCATGSISSTSSCRRRRPTRRRSTSTTPTTSRRSRTSPRSRRC